MTLTSTATLCLTLTLALHNTSQTLATMANVTRPKSRRTPLPLSFMLPPYRAQEPGDICIRSRTCRRCRRYLSRHRRYHSLPEVCVLITCALPSGAFIFVVVFVSVCIHSGVKRSRTRQGRTRDGGGCFSWSRAWIRRYRLTTSRRSRLNGG